MLDEVRFAEDLAVRCSECASSWFDSVSVALDGLFAARLDVRKSRPSA